MGVNLYFYLVATAEDTLADYPAELSEISDYIDLKYNKLSEITTKYLVGYFKNFNALHGYITLNFIKQKHEMAYLTKKEIEELLFVCQQILANPERAENILPTYGGIFLGSIEYNDTYYRNVQEAVSLFKMLLKINLDNYKILYEIS